MEIAAGRFTWRGVTTKHSTMKWLSGSGKTIQIRLWCRNADCFECCGRLGARRLWCRHGTYRSQDRRMPTARIPVGGRNILRQRLDKSGSFGGLPSEAVCPLPPEIQRRPWRTLCRWLPIGRTALDVVTAFFQLRSRASYRSHWKIQRIVYPARMKQELS